MVQREACPSMGLGIHFFLQTLSWIAKRSVRYPEEAAETPYELKKILWSFIWKRTNMKDRTRWEEVMNPALLRLGGDLDASGGYRWAISLTSLLQKDMMKDHTIVLYQSIKSLHWWWIEVWTTISCILVGLFFFFLNCLFGPFFGPKPGQYLGHNRSLFCWCLATTGIGRKE